MCGEIISITDVSYCTQKDRIFAVSETLDGPPVGKMLIWMWKAPPLKGSCFKDLVFDWWCGWEWCW